jgi:hypothetical protein
MAKTILLSANHNLFNKLLRSMSEPRFVHILGCPNTYISQSHSDKIESTYMHVFCVIANPEDSLILLTDPVQVLKKADVELRIKGTEPPPFLDEFLAQERFKKALRCLK